MLLRYDDIERSRSSIPRVLMMVGDTKSASWVWRCVWPTTYLARHGFIADWAPANSMNETIVGIEAGRYNMILTPRAHWTDEAAAQNWYTYIKERNLTWIYEVDDNGWDNDIVHRQAKLFEAEWH